MSFWESFKIAFSAIRGHMLRSILTTIGIMIGVLTVIGMLALIDGLNKTVSHQLSSIGSTTLYVQKYPWVMNRAEYLKTRGRKNLTIADADLIAATAPAVRRAAPTLTAYLNVKHRGRELDGVEIIGTTPAYLYIQDYGIEHGRPISGVDLEHKWQRCMIGATVTEKLFGGLDPAGKSIMIGRYRFTVIAALTKKGSFFGNDQDNVIIIPIPVYTKLF
jgi:putative ABC transport system permease protein